MRSSSFTKPISNFFVNIATKLNDPEVKSILLYVDKCFAIFRANLYCEGDTVGKSEIRRVKCPTIIHENNIVKLDRTYTPSTFLLSNKN